MSFFDALTLVLGLALFLFGMNLMGDTLKKSAGRRLKLFLEKMTANPFKGFLLGFLVTAVIQSSSATTVMVVGFVNSGTMLLSQAVGVIMGANVGTAITSWLTALSGLEGGGAVGSFMQWFKPSTFTPILALIGILLYMVGKQDRKKNLGLILLGFSVLMVGMDTMSGAVSGLSENETFRSILLLFENPILGVLAGMILTAIVQSSSASIGILQSFTVTGAITFGNAIPIILGQNIGTCVTALLASAGANKNAKRASVVHLLFNVFGSVICLGLFYLIKFVIGLPFLDGSIDMWGIAIVHTLFNVITVLLLFPFTKRLEQLAIACVRDKGRNDRFSILDERLLATPSVAIEKSRELTVRMGEMSVGSVRSACDMLLQRSTESGYDRILQSESAVDEYEDKLGTYLLRVSEQSILEAESREVTGMLHLLSDFERISDHAVNLAEAAEEIREKKLTFSDEAKEELSTLIAAVLEITELTQESFQKGDTEAASLVEPLEQVIDGLREEIKQRHIIRLQHNTCTMEHGFILTDILTDLERIADHCSNIAACCMRCSEHNSMELHRYLREYREDHERFDQKYMQYLEKYRLTKEK